MEGKAVLRWDTERIKRRETENLVGIKGWKLYIGWGLRSGIGYVTVHTEWVRTLALSKRTSAYHRWIPNCETQWPLALYSFLCSISFAWSSFPSFAPLISITLWFSQCLDSHSTSHLVPLKILEWVFLLFYLPFKGNVHHGYLLPDQAHLLSHLYFGSQIYNSSPTCHLEPGTQISNCLMHSSLYTDVLHVS